MTEQNLIEIDADDRGVMTLTLNRPDIHNAFDDRLIVGLTRALERIDQEPSVRAVVLTGAGKSFSAGADLNWMRGMASASEEDNRADSLRLAKLMRTLAFMSKPTVARINGAAFGGGVGLVACCDIAIAGSSAKFGLTEVRLGLVPAVISPYVINAIGPRQAMRLFQTAEIIDATEAERLSLVHQSVPDDELDDAVERQLKFLLIAGPEAVKASKSLVGAIAARTAEGQQRMDEQTAALIARLRVSAEGQEGLSAFLDKRKPNWVKK